MISSGASEADFWGFFMFLSMLSMYKASELSLMTHGETDRRCRNRGFLLIATLPQLQGGLDH